MSMWAIKRRLYILLVILAMVLFFSVVPIMLMHFLQKPSCSDTRQNGSESGADCGGSCPSLCYPVQKPLQIRWSRILPVTDTVYSLVFSVENQNFSAFAYRAQYQCVIADNEYKTLNTIVGNVSISSSGTYAVMRNSLSYPDKKPSHVRCAFVVPHIFVALPTQSLANVFSFDAFVSNLDTARPNVQTSVRSSDAVRIFTDSRFVATVYDATNSAVAVSETVVDKISPNTRYNLVFTWPNRFVGTQPFRVEVTPLFEFPEYASKKYTKLQTKTTTGL
jgi:hypothetical protein